MNPTLVVLAAGIGSRYGGLKQVDGIGPAGEAILEYSVFDAEKAGFDKIVFVIRKEIETPFRQKIGDKIAKKIDVDYAFQEFNTNLEWLKTTPYREKPWGTGHAILSAKNQVSKPFAAINADDFYGHTSFNLLGDFLRTQCAPNKCGMIAYQLSNTLSENGAVSRGICLVNENNELLEVTERTKIERINNTICYFDDNLIPVVLPDKTPVSMNFWGFHPDVFDELDHQFRNFVLNNISNPKAEFYIPTVVSNLLNQNKSSCSVMTSETQWFGVTYPEDKNTVMNALKLLSENGTYPPTL